MKKIALTVFLLFSLNAYAASNVNGVSAYFSTGYNPTGMGLTTLMNDPFSSNINTGSLYSTIFGETLYAPMNQLDNSSVLNSSDSKNSLSTGTAFSAGLKFNFLTFLFLRSEFTYDTNSYLPIEYTGKVKNPYSYVYLPANNAEIQYQFSYESISVPVIFGINIPVELKGRHKSDIYIGGGMVWTSTKYIFQIDAPYGFVYYNSASAMPAFKEKLQFESQTFGYTWTVGADYEIFSNLSFFTEVDSFIFQTAFAKDKYKSDTMILYTTGGPKTRMELSYTIIKMGISYKFSDLITNYFF